MRHALRGLALSAALATTAAQAADFAANVGVFEVILLPPAHGGLYPYIGGSVSVPTGPAIFTAALSVEVSFDQGRGGLVAVFTADFPINDHVGLDLNFIVLHDQPGLRFAESQFFIGLGPGATFSYGKWLASLGANVFAGLSVPGFSVGPCLNLARVF